MLHDARGALAADNAAINRVPRIALDKSDAAVLQVHFDAAAAGAHVAGRVFDLVGDARRGIDLFPRRPVIAPAFAKLHAPIIHDRRPETQSKMRSLYGCCWMPRSAGVCGASLVGRPRSR